MTSAIDFLNPSFASKTGTRDQGGQLPNTWPPANDFPITANHHGQPVSRYGDSFWDFSSTSRKPFRINFGDGPQRKDYAPISKENADILRRVIAWYLYGPKAVHEATTLKAKFKLIRPIFVMASAHGILATDLYRYPKVIDELGASLPSSRRDEFISALHTLYEQRDLLGVSLLDKHGIRQLMASMPDHQERQTPYIPPRIWSYVLGRSDEFIAQYLAHQDNIEECFAYTLEKYSQVAGSLEAACKGEYDSRKAPFGESRVDGTFDQVCERFGIRELLETWSSCGNDESFGARVLANYLGMVGYIGTLHIVAHTLMRIEEAWRLRASCHQVHHDSKFGDVHLIHGETSKTLKDSDVVWVASESCVDAIRMMRSAASLRMKVAAGNPDVPTTQEFLDNPYLAPKAYEPWTKRFDIKADLSIRQSYQSLDQVVKMYPKFLDKDQMIITKDDLNVARRVNPTLDETKFSEGMPWILGWHQFRRTGAVNMFASDLVSKYALQHQLKHRSPLMTAYYAQGFTELALDEDTRSQILRAMYEISTQEAVSLLGDHVTSAYGIQHKEHLLQPLNQKELTQIERLAKSGKFPWRRTPFGGCTSEQKCEYGGFDNLIRCGGGDGEPPCAHGLLDRANAPAVLKFKSSIDIQLLDTPEASPHRDWLVQTQAALSNILHHTMQKEQA